MCAQAAIRRSANPGILSEEQYVVVDDITYCLMDVAMDKHDILEAGEPIQPRTAVSGPLAPGAVDGGEGGVGQHDQRGGGVKPGQHLSQPARLGLPQDKARTISPILPDSVKAEKVDSLAGVKKAAFPEDVPAGGAAWLAIAFTPHRQERHGQFRQDLGAQGQGAGVAVVGQVSGKEDQVGRGLKSPDLRHRPG